MIIDLNTNKPTTREGYDVCVSGAGVTGITIANRLAKKGKKVALFEAGGLDYSQQSQDVYAAKTNRKEYEFHVNFCRQRYLGGTSNHWTGRCKPFEAYDFTERPWFDMPGWPINFEEIMRYREDANVVLDLAKNENFELLKEPTTWVSDKFTLDGAALSPPTRFKAKYLSDIKQSDNIHLYINANLTEILLNQTNDKVKKLRIQNYNNDTFFFTGKQTVLTMGALENARSLLNSDQQQQHGVGNQNDMVGRCFMEHFLVDFGSFISNHEFMQPDKRLELYTKNSFSEAHKIGSSNITFAVTSTPPTYGRTRAIKKLLRNSVCKSQTMTRLSRKMTEFKCPGDGTIGTLTEQQPSLDSRVRLSSETQQFGLRGITVDYNITAMDNRTVRTIAIESAKEFARLDFGRVKLKDFVFNESLPIPLGAHCHQMGTTRMAAEAKYGVVDENCRVFGLDNLYIGGSGVFSTGGGNNPTYPIVQLSLRLSDHLATQ